MTIIKTKKVKGFPWCYNDKNNNPTYCNTCKMRIEEEHIKESLITEELCLGSSMVERLVEAENVEGSSPFLDTLSK